MRRIALLLFLAASAFAQADVAVNPDVIVIRGARILDATGKTLIPGLFDLHTHLSASAVTGVSGDWGLFGSSGGIRTYNSSVNSRTSCSRLPLQIQLLAREKPIIVLIGGGL